MQDDLHDATGCGTRAPCMVRAQPSLRLAVSAVAIGGRFASIWPRMLSRSRRLGASGRHPAFVDHPMVELLALSSHQPPSDGCNSRPRPAEHDTRWLPEAFAQQVGTRQ
jgi:hypothetical protein